MRQFRAVGSTFISSLTVVACACGGTDLAKPEPVTEFALGEEVVTSVSFGQVCENVPHEKTLTVWNKGAVDLQIKSARITKGENDFFIANESGEGAYLRTVPRRGGKTDIRIGFKGTGTGIGELALETNEAKNPNPLRLEATLDRGEPYVLSLRDPNRAAPASTKLEEVALAEANRIGFGTVGIGMTGKYEARLTNYGCRELRITRIYVPVKDPSVEYDPDAAQDLDRNEPYYYTREEVDRLIRVRAPTIPEGGLVLAPKQRLPLVLEMRPDASFVDPVEGRTTVLFQGKLIIEHDGKNLKEIDNDPWEARPWRANMDAFAKDTGLTVCVKQDSRMRSNVDRWTFTGATSEAPATARFRFRNESDAAKWAVQVKLQQNCDGEDASCVEHPEFTLEYVSPDAYTQQDPVGAPLEDEASGTSVCDFDVALAANEYEVKVTYRPLSGRPDDEAELTLFAYEGAQQTKTQFNGARDRGDPSVIPVRVQLRGGAIPDLVLKDENNERINEFSYGTATGDECAGETVDRNVRIYNEGTRALRISGAGFYPGFFGAEQFSVVDYLPSWTTESPAPGMQSGRIVSSVPGQPFLIPTGEYLEVITRFVDSHRIGWIPRYDGGALAKDGVSEYGEFVVCSPDYKLEGQADCTVDNRLTSFIVVHQTDTWKNREPSEFGQGQNGANPWMINEGTYDVTLDCDYAGPEGSSDYGQAYELRCSGGDCTDGLTFQWYVLSHTGTLVPSCPASGPVTPPCVRDTNDRDCEAHLILDAASATCGAGERYTAAVNMGDRCLNTVEKTVASRVGHVSANCQ